MQQRYRMARAAELETLAAFRDMIDAACAQHPEVDPQSQYDLKLAVEEACANVITHGYAGMNPGSLILTLEFAPDRVLVDITDFGHPFEPCEPPPPDLEAGLEAGSLGGFGLFFIYQTMDAVGYETEQDGNHLIFVKRLHTSQQG